MFPLQGLEPADGRAREPCARRRLKHTHCLSRGPSAPLVAAGSAGRTWGRTEPGPTPRPPRLPPEEETLPLARPARRLTVTPGPCRRPRESGALRDHAQEKEAAQPSARRARSSTNKLQQPQQQAPSERGQRKQDVLAPAVGGRKKRAGSGYRSTAPPLGWRPHSAGCA